MGMFMGHDLNQTITIGLSFSLLVVAGVQAYIYGIQAKLMRKTIERSDDANRRQLRAYLVYSKVILNTKTGDIWVYASNAGQTPATRVNITSSRSGVELPHPINYVAPGVEVPFHVPAPPGYRFDKTDHSPLLSLSHSYCDIFKGKPHTASVEYFNLLHTEDGKRVKDHLLRLYVNGTAEEEEY